MELVGALLLLCVAAPLCASSAAPEPYDSLFDTAVEAYYRGDWLSVILNMEKALRNKAAVRRVKAHCRIRCANHSAFGGPAPGARGPGGAPNPPGAVPGAGSVDDLGFFQKILRRADCVQSCESEQLGVPSMHQAGEEVELEFRKRTPYNYLQVAYFKVNKLDKAVAAAYTFFQANPDHVEMRQNLDYYRMMAGVQEENFKDLEARPHMAEFLLGKQHYSDDLFDKAAAHFEAAVDEYFTADRECRALCEGAYHYDGYNYMEYSADLYQTVTDHYMQVLNCKQQCSVELASAAGREKPFEDFLPSHFNYLQFSYYNSEKYEQAIECAKTFLLFHPQDEVMNQNLNYYSAVLGEEKARSISARQVVQQFIQQSILEKELLYYRYEAFGITFVDPDAWTPEDVMPQKLRDKQKAEKETAARITEEIGNLMKEIEILVEEKKKDSSDMATIIAPPEGSAVLPDSVSLTMTPQQLNGSQRVLLDNVIGQDECRELQRLSNAAAQKGDGYRGQPSPHTPSESFQGVTVLRAVKLAQEGKVPLKSARLFFDISEKVRKMLESYFLLNTPLYFSYSHLVCRSAIDEKQKRDPDDLSHPVHVDNCVLVSEINECVKDPLYYTYRDYSAILYLNDDFEGGEFIFTELDAKTVTAEVHPRCGRVVGFGAGKENPHGVRAVTKGQRCAVALWFTLDPVHEEKERIQAQDMLKMFSTPLNSEFTLKETGNTLDSKPLTAEAPPQAEQAAVEKQGDAPQEQKTDNTQEEKPTTPPTDAPEKKTVSKATTKTKPKGKATSGDKTKPKTAAKAKPAAKKGGKQTEKAKAKQVDKIEAKSATKQTVVSEKDPPSGSESQSGKEEL